MRVLLGEDIRERPASPNEILREVSVVFPTVINAGMTNVLTKGHKRLSLRLGRNLSERFQIPKQRAQAGMTIIKERGLRNTTLVLSKLGVGAGSEFLASKNVDKGDYDG